MSRELRNKDFRDEWKELKVEFENCQKKIRNYETRPLGDENRRIQYKDEIINEYNKIIEWIAKNIEQFDRSSQEKLLEKIDAISNNLIARLKTLGFEVNLPEDRLDTLTSNSINGILNETKNSDTTEEINESLDFEESESTETSPGTGAQSESLLHQSNPSTSQQNNLNIPNDSDNNANNNRNNDSNSVGVLQQNTNMVMTKIEFLGLCGKTIVQMYNGEPGGLSPFLNAIKLLQSMYDGTEHDATLKAFIMTKLSGKALDCVPTEPENIGMITKALKDYIKPESSKVIAGKMMALKADRNNFADYAKKTEELSDCFKRALILEGIPTENANAMTIEKTVELCKTNTNSIQVKSILASTKFDLARDVVAKFIIESRSESSEQKIFHFNSNKRGNSNSRKNFNRNNYSSGNGQRNNSNNGSQNGNYRNGRGNFRSNGNNRGGYARNGNNHNRQNRVYYAENRNASPPGAQTQGDVQLAQADQ